MFYAAAVITLVIVTLSNKTLIFKNVIFITIQ